MRLAFVAVGVPGHANPTGALARRLKARGHDVILIATPDAEPLLRSSEVPFVPYCEKDYPTGSIARIQQQLSKLQGEEALAFTYRLVAESLESAFGDLARVLRKTRSDAVVIDIIQMQLGLVPRHLGLPYAHISNSLPMDFSGKTPVGIFDWPHETAPAALARNQEGVLRCLQFHKPRTLAALAYAKRVGLDVDPNDRWLGLSQLAWLTQMPKEFDFQASQWPSQFHYTGPFHDGVGRSAINFPWDRLTGEPLIYASMGTLQNGVENVFNTIAEAVGTRPGFQLVLSVGPVIDPGALKSLPDNTIVVNRAPQLDLLKRSALCITHAGLNTTLESLTQGVPMVAIPVTNDQPGVAARIAYTKTGRFLPLHQLAVPGLSSLIDEVLNNPEYRRNAHNLAHAIAATDGMEHACGVLEQALGLPAPVR